MGFWKLFLNSLQCLFFNYLAESLYSNELIFNLILNFPKFGRRDIKLFIYILWKKRYTPTRFRIS